tara:strand:- start:1316 stop:1441 length:126 start_codon:yes stop_codon:yes gene_type:complete
MIPKEDRWKWLEMKVSSIFWDMQLIKEKLEIIEKETNNEND